MDVEEYCAILLLRWSELKFVSCQVMVKKEKKKRRERTRKVRNKAVVCVCLDVKM